MIYPYEIVNNSHVGPFIIGLHFHKLKQNYPNLEPQSTTTTYLRFDYNNAISLYVDKDTSNLIGVKVLQAGIAQYLGVMVGTTKSQVKKLQSPPNAPGIILDYHEKKVSEIIVFSEQEGHKRPDLYEEETAPIQSNFDFKQFLLNSKKAVPVIIGLVIVLSFLFGSFQYSKNQLKAKPSFTLKAVVGQTKDNRYLSFTVNIHPKISTKQTKVFHRKIRDDIQNNLVLYINNHSKKELYLFNNGRSLAVNIGKFLNVKSSLLNTDHELVVKNIRIKG